MDKKEKYKYARAFVVLLAALITMIFNLKYKRDLMQSLLILLAVIVVFYVISSSAIYLIDKIAGMGAKKEVVEDKEASEDEEPVEDAAEDN
ncbi:MAG: hypothetical protein NC393_11150 [Clostridium sp.]|nr:hypothetical protein [Clostridium sp.]MCM1172663.1 hypothetical protein [Clostridium sp.]MCM1207677.1 hypothetical protein [Ruminococcus sp.]